MSGTAIFAPGTLVWRAGYKDSGCGTPWIPHPEDQGKLDEAQKKRLDLITCHLNPTLFFLGLYFPQAYISQWALLVTKWFRRDFCGKLSVCSVKSNSLLTPWTIAHPSVNECLPAFYLSVIANVDMNTGVQISDRVPAFNFGGYISKSAIPESNSVFNFLRTALAYHFPQWIYNFTFPLPVHSGFNFSTSIPYLFSYF